MVVFSNSLSNNVITKHRNVHDVISLILTLVLIPIYSCIITHLGEWTDGNRAAYNSLSALAHIDGHLIWVVIWGLLNVGAFVYLIILNSFDGGMNKYLRAFFIICAFVGLILLTSASIFPYNQGTSDIDIRNKNLHNSFAHWGFGFVVVEFCLYSLTIFFRNKKQFFISFLSLIFVMTISLYLVFEANEKEISPTDISSVAQVCIFLLFNAYLTFLYLSNRLFKITQSKKA